MYFHFKEPRARIPDIGRDPHRKHAERKAKANIPKMKFESEGQRRDYERDILSNPRNIYGGPQFFPPVEIKSFVSGHGELTDEEEIDIMERKINSRSSGVVPLPCPDCHPLSHRQHPDEMGNTPHWISYDICKCQLCGAEKPYRTRNIQFDIPTVTSRMSNTSIIPQG